MMQNKLKIIGVMGNSGSGKSSVCRILKNKGAYIIDADKIAHEVIEQDGAAYEAIVDFFGVGILDEHNNIVRKRLGSLVFSDEDKRKTLEGITHQYILQDMYTQMEWARNQGDRYQFIVLDAPLLVEANLHTTVDQVWLVHANEEIRLGRIMARDDLTREQALLRLKSQMPFEELQKFADVIIDNDGNMDGLDEQVSRILGRDVKMDKQ